MSADATCSYAWEDGPSSGPFMRYGDYRFQYVEALGRAEVNGQGKDQPKIPLNILFSPVPEAYLGGKLLGQGWWLPPFESTLLQTDGHTYVMGLPNGDKVTLRKNGSSLKGGSWLGTIGDRETVLKTSCGWGLKFQQGRLVELTSPTHERYLFAISRDGVRTVTYNGRIVLTLTRKIDEQTTFPVYFLSYVSEGKSQKAELRMGLRPILVKYVEKENERDVPKEREENTYSLSSVKVEGKKEKKYDFGLDTLATTGSTKFLGQRKGDGTPSGADDAKDSRATIRKDSYKWDGRTGFLLQEDEKRFSVVNIQGIPCLRTMFPDGRVLLNGSKNNVYITQQMGGPVSKTEYFGIDVDSLAGKVRQISHVNPDGSETLVRKYWYDENGQERKVFVRTHKNEEHLYIWGKNVIVLNNDKNKQQIWKKVYDPQGRLIEFHTGKGTQYFNYQKGGSILVQFVNEAGKKIVELPLESLSDEFKTELVYPKKPFSNKFPDNREG